MAEARRRPSIARRLAVSLIVLLLVGGFGVALAALAYGRAAANRSYDRLLIGAADQIAASVVLRDGAVSVDMPSTAFDLLALAPDDRIVYAVIGPNGQVLTGYDVLAGLRVGQRFFNATFTGEAARFVQVTRRFTERGFTGSVRVLVGQTLRARQALAREITTGALIIVAFVGVVISVLAALFVRAALRPLDRIEARLLARDPRDLTPIEVDAPREVGRLIDTLNHFMGRIDRQIRTMQTLIGDASHQLRTPVAALRSQAELAAEETDPAALRAIVARIHQRSINLGRLTDQLLSHAMIIHRAESAPQDRIDLRTVAMRAVKEADADHGVSDDELVLDLPESDVMVEGDALSLVEACKNLIANALKHGKVPVTMTVALEGGRAVLAVRDCGPGIPRQDWPNSARRYSSQSGVSPTSAGLGVAIAHAVARAHHGRFRFRYCTPEGFEAALVLPLVTGVAK